MPKVPRGRLTTPLVRDDGTLREASWDEALDRAAAGLARARDAGGDDVVRDVLLLEGDQRDELPCWKVRQAGDAVEQRRLL